MHANWRVRFILPSVLLLAACVSLPNSPSVMALPGTGKSFDQFRADDAACRQYAYGQIGGMTANQAASDSLARSAIVGAALGTAVGVATGGGRGAGVGAATGLALGSAVGVDSANASSFGAQRRYDNAYIQCMYGYGHRVPVSGHMTTEQRPGYYPPPSTYPPPPPGYSR